MGNILRAQRWIDQARLARTDGVGEIRIDVENTVPVFQDKSAVTEPPQGRTITAGGLNFLE
jgi:hypothetical protein